MYIQLTKHQNGNWFIIEIDRQKQDQATSQSSLSKHFTCELKIKSNNKLVLE